MTSVYLVEDQPALQKQLHKALGAFDDVQIVGAAMDGATAVREIESLRPDLVLLDLELPDMNGIEITRKVKSTRPEVEVLILTTFDDEQKVYEAIQAGASGYLVKRVGPEKIHSAIAEVMAGGTVLEAQIAKRFWNYFHSVQTNPPQRQNPWGLTEEELQVLQYVARGLSNAEVGQVMSLQRRTVRTHLSHVYKKMGVSSHVEAVVLALKSGCVDL